MLDTVQYSYSVFTVIHCVEWAIVWKVCWQLFVVGGEMCGAVIGQFQFRNPSTHKMGPWVRKFFLHLLPKLLMIERPRVVQADDQDLSASDGASVRTLSRPRNERNIFFLQEGEGFASPRGQKTIGLNPDVKNAVSGINFIVEHVRETTNFGNVNKPPQLYRRKTQRLSSSHQRQQPRQLLFKLLPKHELHWRILSFDTMKRLD